MVMHFSKGQGETYDLDEVGRDDSQSEVEVTQVKAVCRVCGIEYTDQPSIDMVREWIASGYAPCPTLPCPGEFEIVGE